MSRALSPRGARPQQMLYSLSSGFSGVRSVKPRALDKYVHAMFAAFCGSLVTCDATW